MSRKKRSRGLGFQVKPKQGASSPPSPPQEPPPTYSPDALHWVGSMDSDSADPFAGTLDGCLSVALFPLTPEDTEFQQLRQVAIKEGSVQAESFEIEYKPQQAEFWIREKGAEIYQPEVDYDYVEL